MTKLYIDRDRQKLIPVNISCLARRYPRAIQAIPGL